METVSVSVVCTVTLRSVPNNVKQLEEAVIAETQRAARELFAQGFAALQTQWLEQRHERFAPVRWRTTRRLTSFGEVKLPVRVVRRRDRPRGGYLSLGKVLWRAQATRLLSPQMERLALEAAAEQNFRPAAKRLSERCGEPIRHGMVWRCVQHHGERLVYQLERDQWPDVARRRQAEVVVTEVDATYLRRQHHGADKRGPSHFLMHLGLHYTGRERRWGKRGATDAVLRDKTLLLSAESVGIFGARLRRQRDRHFGAHPSYSVLLSDGDTGIRWLHERSFEESVWLLDRWHLSRAVRAFVGADQAQYQRLMQGVWRSDSEAVLEALRQTPESLQRQRAKEFHAVFGYVLGNRDGIDAWAALPARWRRAHGRRLAVIKSGSGAVEKNIECVINRRFKGQGRSWNPRRAERLAQLRWLIAQPRAWQRWWQRQYARSPN